MDQHTYRGNTWAGTELVYKLLVVPDCFDTWLPCWRAYRSILAMCQAATVSTRDKYEKAMYGLNQLHVPAIVVVHSGCI